MRILALKKSPSMISELGTKLTQLQCIISELAKNLFLMILTSTSIIGNSTDSTSGATNNTIKSVPSTNKITFSNI